MSEQMERNKAIVRRYQEAYNSGNLDVLDELLDPNWMTNAFPSAVLEQTIENAKVVQRLLVEAFPDLHVTTEQLIAEDDYVVQLWTWRGTHKGDVVGLPASGNQVVTGGMSLFKIEDGKIVRHIAFNDMMDLLSQIGADIPAEWLAFGHGAAPAS